MEHPILFSSKMIRAIQCGKKTQTRRVIKVARDNEINAFRHHMAKALCNNENEYFEFLKTCPYGRIGDHLWVRETWTNTPYGPLYKADVDDDFTFVDPPYVGCTWKPSIHMPRQYSRILLRVENVHAKRLHEMTVYDMEREGIDELDNNSHPLTPFIDLWDSLNAKRGFSWATNPFVWVVTFSKVR